MVRRRQPASPPDCRSRRDSVEPRSPPGRREAPVRCLRARRPPAGRASSPSAPCRGRGRASRHLASRPGSATAGAAAWSRWTLATSTRSGRSDRRARSMAPSEKIFGPPPLPERSPYSESRSPVRPGDLPCGRGGQSPVLDGHVQPGDGADQGDLRGAHRSVELPRRGHGRVVLGPSLVIRSALNAVRGPREVALKPVPPIGEGEDRVDQPRLEPEHEATNDHEEHSAEDQRVGGSGSLSEYRYAPRVPAPPGNAIIRTSRPVARQTGQ